jgi:hypothetical protein
MALRCQGNRAIVQSFLPITDCLFISCFRLPYLTEN